MRRRERGSVVPLLALAVLLAGAVAMGLARVASAASARAQARTAADAAALAGSAEGADSARRLASVNGADLLEFRRLGPDVRVTVRVRESTASARASSGPVPLRR